MKNLDYLIGHILYQIFKIALSIPSKKKHEAVTDNPPIRIYVNKIEKMITLRIKTGHYLELLTPETMKDKNDENVLLLEINELVLVHCYIVDNDY